MKTSRRTIGPRPYPTLRAWRQAQGLNQRDAAVLLEISQKSYSRVESGQQYVKGQLAARLMSRTGVPLEVLVGVAV